MKICKVCGASHLETRMYGELCRKHYLQFKRYGSFLTRTIYDPNTFIIDGDQVFIELYDTRGNTVAVAIVDVEDYPRVKDYKWYYRKGYVATTVNGEKVFLHRFIMNTPKGFFVDHKNGNTLDNRKENLRNCTKAENGRNRINRSHVAGIQQTPSGKFTAVITVMYKTLYLGTFNTIEDAEDARVLAEKKYFGEYRPQ